MTTSHDTTTSIQVPFGERAQRIRLHAPGIATVLIVAVCLVLSLAWHWEGAAAIAVLGLVSRIVGLLTVLRPVTIDVAVATTSSRIVVGRVAVAEILVKSGRRASAATVVDLPVGDLVATFLVPRLAPGEEWLEPFLISTQRRQVLSLGPATAVRSDALGLWSRDTRLSEREEIFVHPATAFSEYDAMGLLRDLEGVQSSTLSDSDVAFHALRDYVPGDDRRHVHWPTVARVGRLMVRQFEETRRSHHLVVVDAREGSYGDMIDKAGELALSIGASYGVEALMLERNVMVRMGEREMPLGTPVRLLDAISAVEFTSEGPNLAQLVHAGVRTAPQLSAVTIITGKHVDDEELARAIRAVPLSASSQVLRAVATGRSRRRQLEGAPVFTCSSLDELHRIAAAVTT